MEPPDDVPVAPGINRPVNPRNWIARHIFAVLSEFHRRAERRRPVQSLAAAVHRPMNSYFNSAQTLSHLRRQILIADPRP